MLKYSKNYHINLNFTAQSTNLTHLENFCSKRESMPPKQLKNLAFFDFLFSENGSFSGLKVKKIIKVFVVIKVVCKIKFFKNPRDLPIILPLFKDRYNRK